MTLSSLAKNLALGACAVVLVAAADAATAPRAAAQDRVIAANNDVVIIAPYAVRGVAKGRVNGLPVETVSLSRPVSYAGLDLRRPGDVDEFQRRIVVAAHETCGQLKQLYPRELSPPQSSDRACVNGAIRGGYAQANMVIAAHNGG